MHKNLEKHDANWCILIRVSVRLKSEIKAHAHKLSSFSGNTPKQLTSHPGPYKSGHHYTSGYQSSKYGNWYYHSELFQIISKSNNRRDWKWWTTFNKLSRVRIRWIEYGWNEATCSFSISMYMFSAPAISLTMKANKGILALHEDFIESTYLLKSKEPNVGFELNMGWWRNWEPALDRQYMYQDNW